MFAGLQHELEGYAVRLVCFLIEMITVDEPVIFRGLQFFIGDLFGVQGGELVDANYIKILNQLLVNLAAMNLQYPDVAGRLFIEVQLLRDTGDEITDDAILGDEYFERVL